jgi:hypothetical protein
MTVTTALTVATVPGTPQSTPGWRLFRTGAVAGVAACVATAAVAALAQVLGVPLNIAGHAIPLAGFAQLTFTAVIVGTILAVVMSYRAARPRNTFVTTAVALTLVSIVPDLLVDARAATKLTLAMTHVIAAAIVIPAIASDLSD